VQQHPLSSHPQQKRVFPKKGHSMNDGYRVKMQKVECPTNRSFYVNFPVALAQAMNLKKGEEFDWIFEDKNTLIF
jgi:hypothetical protein